MSKEKTEIKQDVVVYSGREDLYEFMNNIIQDAQASGSIVQIITIFPETTMEGSSDASVEVKGCKPKAVHCPKGNY
ncbi:MAG: hypothetical protein AB2551_21040 [Candidatus Thiodiazotropha sp.]